MYNFFLIQKPISWLLQMPTPKVGLFGTSSKMGSKIRKISKIQSAVKIARINEIHWNLRQMEALGLNFRFFLKFWIFVNFWRFCTHLNIPQIRIFGNYQNYRKSMVFERLSSKLWIHFLKFFFTGILLPTLLTKMVALDCAYL